MRPPKQKTKIDDFIEKPIPQNMVLIQAWVPAYIRDAAKEQIKKDGTKFWNKLIEGCLRQYLHEHKVEL